MGKRERNQERLLTLTSPRAIAIETGGVWGAAEIMHLAHFAALDPAAVAVALAGCAYGKTRNATTAAALAGIGAWSAAATAWGSAGGPDGALTLLLAGAAIGGGVALNRTETVRAARAFRRCKRNWLIRSGRYGLHGSHVIAHELTRLGEQFTVDVSETPRLASTLPNSNLAELIATDRKLPRNRVRVIEPKGPAGRIRVSVRDEDPWAHAIAHPLFDRRPEIELASPESVRHPLIVGQDPETGSPLELPVWRPDRGGRNIYILSQNEGGKTTLINCLRERLTACPNALVFGINVSKASEDHEWAPACHLTAIGDSREQIKKALMILRLVRLIISRSPDVPRNDKIILPRREWPAVILIIDEVDALIELGGSIAVNDLRYISSKGRSESVSLIAAGQRGTAAWMGGADIRSQLHTVCVGKTRGMGEVAHAVGREYASYVPDMTFYGEGHPGVWAIVHGPNEYSMGRTFDLSELPELRQIAYERSNPDGHLNPALVDRIGGLYGQLVEMQQHEYHGGVLLATPPATTATEAVGGGGSSEPGSVAVLDRPGGASGDGDGRGGTPPGDDWDTALADLEKTMADDLRPEIDRIRERRTRLAGDVQSFNETEMPDMSDIPQDVLDRFRESRWAKQAAKTIITGEQRAKIMGLLAGEGTTTKTVAAVLGITPTDARYMLERLRLEGKATVAGKGRAARWVTGTTPADGDN